MELGSRTTMINVEPIDATPAPAEPVAAPGGENGGLNDELATVEESVPAGR